jgi:Mg-chelatase subunit ChlD/MoxR-like ATPase
MPIFPWSAVLGQERLKQALLLCSIDPGIGGVLVRGPRGVAKTTLARAFAELLPGRFVELPLGASEERVTGSLDLGKALGQGEVQFSPGLLARADEGVLYVDEVNLLPDSLVDLLLDAAATGQNVVERDGVSHVHAARFVLIGTMNPEEGELRPQLGDRFGLAVVADAVLTPDERTQIVLRRLEFERDPEGFIAAFAAEQRALIERCRAARRRARELPFAGPGVARAAELCHAAGVDGVRADLAMLRAARAHAAWHERSEILPGDVDAVAELALAHRRRVGPTGNGQPSGSGGGGTLGGGSPGDPSRGGGTFAESAGRDAASGGAAPGNAAPAAGSGDGKRRGVGPGTLHGADGATDAKTSTRSGDDVDARAASSAAGSTDAGTGGAPSGRGALHPVAVRSIAPPRLPAGFLDPVERAHWRERRARRSPGAQRRQRGAQIVSEGAIDWFATLSREPRPTPADVIRRPRHLARGGRWVLALDCSASMLQSGALGVAKGVARALLGLASSAAARIELVSFGGRDVHNQSASAGAKATIDDAIARLGAAGGTPVRRALQLGLDLASRTRTTAIERRLILFTDGRTRENLAGLASAHPDVDITVIDCERGPLRLQRARSIATTLTARYVHIESLLNAEASDINAVPPPTSTTAAPRHRPG